MKQSQHFVQNRTTSSSALLRKWVIGTPLGCLPRSSTRTLAPYRWRLRTLGTVLASPFLELRT